MKIKPYVDVFELAKQHPRAKEFMEEARARIKLGEALYHARQAKSFSMAKLAKSAGTTPAVISRIENAQVSAGIDLIYKIFKALGKKEFRLNFG